MVLSAKAKNSGGGSDGWGTGFLLIFFPEDEGFSKKKTLLSLSSSSPFSARSPSAAPLISKTRSTLSICGLLVFTTVLLFTLSTFEPTAPFRPSSRRLLLTNHPNSRKQSITMQQPPPPHNSLSKFKVFFHHSATDLSKRKKSKALQGMGTLYRRGTKAMPDLIVGHVREDVTGVEFRSFIRMLHHNGLLSRSDLVLVYHSPSSKLSSVVEEESESFLKLVCLYREMKNSTSRDSFLARYLKTGKEQVGREEKEPVWGKGSQKLNSTERSDELLELNYGSLVGFDASELDPEDSLSGFLDHAPLKLRRWACYPLLLGRVRRNYKHMMLVDVKDILVLQDPLTRIRNQSPESLFLWTTAAAESTRSRHDRKKSSAHRHHHHDEDHQKAVFSPSIIVGGSRGVRRFASAMLNEIVRVTMEHKGRNRSPVSESGLVGQLVRTGYISKSINLVEPGESIWEVSSVSGLKSVDSAGLLLLLSSSSSASRGESGYMSVVERGHSSSSSSSSNFDVDSVIRTVICSSSDLYSSVYKDCLADQ